MNFSGSEYCSMAFSRKPIKIIRFTVTFVNSNWSNKFLPVRQSWDLCLESYSMRNVIPFLFDARFCSHFTKKKKRRRGLGVLFKQNKWISRMDIYHRYSWKCLLIFLGGISRNLRNDSPVSFEQKSLRYFFNWNDSSRN